MHKNYWTEAGKNNLLIRQTDSFSFCSKSDMTRQRAGVQVYPHRLRHTAARQLLSAGCRVTSIQKFLGHKELSPTMIHVRGHDQTVADDYSAAMQQIEKRPDISTSLNASLLRTHQQASTPIQWEIPSHPEVGGGPLAGTIPGLDELPADIPVFVGSGRAPYKLFWELRDFEYEAIRECVAGPNANGNYNCGNGTGHREVVGYEWKRHSSGGEIPPSAVQDCLLQ